MTWINPPLVRLALLGAALLGLIGTTACSVQKASQPAGQGLSLTAEELEPPAFIGKGQGGESPANPEVLEVTAEECDEVRKKSFRVAVAYPTVASSFQQLQIKGLKDTLKKCGVQVGPVTDANWNVDKNISDVANLVQLDVDGIITIPVDAAATERAYEAAADASIKLVFLQNVSTKLRHGEQYATTIGVDNRGNAEVAAKALADVTPKGGTIVHLNYAVDFFATNERRIQFEQWMKEHRPDIKIDQVDFTDLAKVGAIFGDYLTGHPDIDGVYAVWDVPAMEAIGAAREQGIHLPFTTQDLGEEAARDMASPNGYILAVGAQDGYAQGRGTAKAMIKALLGDELPPFIGFDSIAVTPANLLTTYEDLFHEPVAETIAEACRQKPSCHGGD